MADNAKQPRREMDQSWYKRYPRDEYAETSILRCDEYGTLQRFRDYSLIHGGLEDDIVSIIRIGATFQLSKYKVTKIWNVIEKFFTLRDGRYFYEQDELERDSMFVISCKRQLAGKLGAAARWSERNNSPKDATESVMANGMANGNRLPSESDGKRGGEPELEQETTGGNPPPPTPASENGGGGGSPPPESGQLTTDHEFLAIAQRALDLGMAVPTRQLAARVRRKFSDRPIEAVVKSLVRWEGQEHVGLWDKKSVSDFDLEAARQASPASGDRKPTSKEQHQREMLDAAREVDRQRKAQAK
jgi:hypothetical protein